YILWMGDFSHHHPIWELRNNTHLFTAENLNAVAKLTNVLSLCNLVQILPPGTATLEVSNIRNLTHTNNVFCSA
ncbi:hypothetical protein BDR03DRAFT_883530, partial [Suillus americanus]